MSTAKAETKNENQLSEGEEATMPGGQLGNRAAGVGEPAVLVTVRGGDALCAEGTASSAWAN
jgi:hypothetical protein